MTEGRVSSPRVLRYEIPVDDQIHELTLPGGTLHVATRRPDVVEMWCQDEGKARLVRLLVVGTGHPWPPGAFHIGTAIIPGGALVWHLLVVPDV